MAPRFRDFTPPPGTTLAAWGDLAVARKRYAPLETVELRVGPAGTRAQRYRVEWYDGLGRRYGAHEGRFEGGPAERDAAYHQGSAWPWLLGPFVDAHLAVRGRSPESRRRASAWLAPLLEHLLGPGLGQLPEVFDGDPPHRAGGCVAQAWSVGEVLRAVLKTGG